MFDSRRLISSEASAGNESETEARRQTFAVPFKLRSLEAQQAADLLLRLADGDPMSAIKAISEHYSKHCGGRLFDAAGLLKRVLACVVSERQSLKVKRDVAHSDTLANRTRPWTCKPESNAQVPRETRPQTAKASLVRRPAAGNSLKSSIRRTVVGAGCAHNKQRNPCNQIKGRPVSAPMRNTSAHRNRPQGSAPPFSSTCSRPAAVAAHDTCAERCRSPWCVDARTGLPGLEGQAYSASQASEAGAQAGDGAAATVESLVAQGQKPKLDRCWNDSNVQVLAWFKERQAKHKHQKDSQTRVHIREMEWLNSVVQRQVDRTQRIRQEERDREAKLRKEQEAAEEKRSHQMRRMISGSTACSQPPQEATSLPDESNTVCWTRPSNTEGTAQAKSPARVGKTDARRSPSTSSKRIHHSLQEGPAPEESSSARGGDAVTKMSAVHSDGTSQQFIPEQRLSDESNKVDTKTVCPSQNVGGRVGKRVTIRAWQEDDTNNRTEEDAKDSGSTFFLTQQNDA